MLRPALLTIFGFLTAPAAAETLPLQQSCVVECAGYENGATPQDRAALI